MDEKHQFYIEVRKLFEKKQSESKIMSELSKKGHSKEEIIEMINEYKKDEASSLDDKLIKEIERRFKKGESLEIIFADLSKKHDPFEVKKAILRTELVNFDYKTFFINLLKSSQIFLIIILDVLFAIFINKLFWWIIPLLVITFALYSAYGTRRGRKLNSSEISYELARTKIEIVPLGGMHITQGQWGWNSETGIYPRFWLMNLGISFLIIHFVFGILMIKVDFTAGILAMVGGFFSFVNLYFDYRKLI